MKKGETTLVLTSILLAHFLQQMRPHISTIKKKVLLRGKRERGEAKEYEEGEG